MFVRSQLELITSARFIFLSVMGNIIVMSFATVFYLIESQYNPMVDEYIDAVWWAFATVTTVGYGDITPDSFAGRLLGIVLMLVGTAIFASYIALFSDAFLKLDLQRKKRR